jgi:alpha-galactosidase
MINAVKPFYTLRSDKCSLIIDCRGRAPVILYWGAKFNTIDNGDIMAALSIRQELPACQPEEAAIALSPETAAGFIGCPGVQIHRQGKQWAISTAIESVEASSQQLVIKSICSGAQVQLTHRLVLDDQTDILTGTTEITNVGNSTLWVDRCDAPCIPLPAQYTKILGFTGRWANEFQRQNIDRFTGAYVRENRSGRTSHDSFPGVILHADQTTESSGEAYGLHLGWSGNHHVRVEQMFTGRAYAQLGELFYPGEMSLESGETYCSPTLYGASTVSGLSALSGCFHSYIRNHLIDQNVANKRRPVHFNTWEAVYFDLSFEHLRDLADSASDVGAERFILDDGWFKNRKSDKAGLGDWFVDKSVFPNGLGPVINYVQAKNMEFGLWVEPEMVNPDSDLYRAHPDWILNADPAPLILSRNQLVLDLTRREVQHYLFERLDALLTEYSISYLKWDMNRAVYQPGNGSGQAATHHQVVALYDLLKRIREVHPQVEIESCSSGGGRADFGILRYTDRIWTSDSNDAVDRLGIQEGFSIFFPPEIMGAHVGPRDCHITGRSISMDTRAGVALFGHMGIEANLLEMDIPQKQTLKEAIKLHKKHRELLHSGRLVRLDVPQNESAFGVLASDYSEALFSYVQQASLLHSVAGKLRFTGLDIDSKYELNVVWPPKFVGPSKSAIEQVKGSVIGGDVLVKMGMQLPIMQPETMLIFHLRRLNVDNEANS